MKRPKSYIPAIAVTLLIPLLSLVNPDRLPDASALNFTGLDKVIHMLMYATLTGTWAFAMPAKIHSDMRWMLTLAFTTSFYGLILEICQFLFTVSRSMDMFDAAANLVGALIASMVVYRIRKIKLSHVTLDEGTQPTEISEVRNQRPE